MSTQQIDTVDELIDHLQDLREQHGKGCSIKLKTWYTQPMFVYCSVKRPGTEKPTVLLSHEPH